MLPEPKLLTEPEVFELAKRGDVNPVPRSSAHRGEGDSQTILMFRLDHLTAFLNDLLTRAYLEAQEPFVAGEVVPVHVYYDTRLNVTRVVAPTTGDRASVASVLQSGLQAIAVTDPDHPEMSVPDDATIH